jgi:GT2 family glycosyltransferase
MKNPKLSVVILNYNTKDLLTNCIKSLVSNTREVDYEIIVVDNGSHDDSVSVLRKLKFLKNTKFTIVENNKNLGFAAGNNKAKKLAKGKYVLFLNTDAFVKRKTIRESVNYLDANKSVGALTVRTLLPNGQDDKDSRRSFPTPWVSITHFLGLGKIFPNSRLFARYWYGGFDYSTEMEVDVIQGAYFMARRKILDTVGWFDEDYFLDGEDIDLCWKIKTAGWKIIYYPKVQVVHWKGATKGKNKQTKRNINLRDRLKYRLAGVRSMEMFYRKHMWKNYPLSLNYIVLVGIKLKKLQRFIFTVILG